MSLPHVCIIGAGSSGIAAAKALHQRGIKGRSKMNTSQLARALSR